MFLFVVNTKSADFVIKIQANIKLNKLNNYNEIEKKKLIVIWIIATKTIVNK